MEEQKRVKNPLVNEKAANRLAAMFHPSLSFMATSDGIVDEIKTRRSCLPPAELRKLNFMLGVLPDVKPTAEYVVIVSCAAMATPNEIASYFRLLEKYGVDFTVLDDEMCCGFLATEQSTVKEDWEALERAKEAAKVFAKDNLDAAMAKGAKDILHFCIWCLYTYNWAKKEGAFGEEGEKVGQLHYMQPIFDRMDKVKLRMEKPTVIGYYEGCHLRTDAVYPGVKIDWSQYRQLLDRIENAKIVDLKNICCLPDAEKVVDNAMKEKVDVMTSPCYACWMYTLLASRAMGGPPSMFYPALIGQAAGV